MYPYLRYTKSIVEAIIAKKNGANLDLADTGEITLRCRLNDIDPFFEMNNGRALTLYDFGRTDFAIRTGLGKMLLKKRWGLVVAGSTIQYRKRIRAFDKVVIKTKIAAIDDRWVYVEQSMWVKGKPCSSVILRTGVTQKGRVIETSRILAAMGKPGWQRSPTGYVKQWIDSDSHRPWPPEHMKIPQPNND